VTQSAREIADRKALLVTRAELDRSRLLLAIYEIRAIVSPSMAGEGALHLKPAAKILVAILGPFIGGQRLSRWLRILSLAIAGYRMARNWRQQ